MKPAALVFALAAFVPAAARAGETACWFEQGVIVAPASIAGLAGDYIIDDRTKNGVSEFQGVHIHFGQPGFETWEQVVEHMRPLA